jgi:hypothetical protein
VDSFCCAVAWDSICCDEAETVCSGSCAAGCAGGDGGGADGGTPVSDCCCPASGAIGCSDATCEGCVCGVDSFCCAVAWDSICCDEAETVCAASCPC